MIDKNGLQIEEIVAHLKDSTEADALEQVPDGPKENLFFMVDNQRNVERRSKGKQSEYFDDCGVWISKATCTMKIVLLLDDSNNIIRRLHVKGEQYCIPKMVNKKRNLEPLTPQPPNDKILILRKNYARLKRSPEFTRRVTWISQAPASFPLKSLTLAIYEYIGNYPGHSIHGKAKKSERPYTRTRSEIMDAICKKNKLAKPKAVYDEMVRGNHKFNRPVDRKQIANKKYRESRKEYEEKFIGVSTNYADNVIGLENMCYTHPFVQSVTHNAEMGPSVILYTKEQILDIQRFCLKDGHVLSFDKTFNLGDLESLI